MGTSVLYHNNKGNKNSFIKRMNIPKVNSMTFKINELFTVLF